MDRKKILNKIIRKIIYICLSLYDKIIPFDIWNLKIRCKNKTGKLNDLIIQLYNEKNEKKGSFIGHKCKITKTPIFPHGLLGIFISNGATIGDNCIIYQQVTIGSNSIKESKSFGAPTIGSNVLIGAGAKIIGGIKIGDNCRIGANCVITENIPKNSVVVLSKPRVIQKMTITNNWEKYE